MVFAAALVPTTLLWVRRSDRVMDDGLGLTLSTAFDNDEIGPLGLEYLTLNPVENDIDRLKSLLTASADEIGLDEQSKLDFVNGDTVRVDGWVLSRTEARRYALYSLVTE